MVQLVLQCLLEFVPDRPLRIRATHIEWNLMHAFHLGGDLRATQNETNLRSIAMSDRYIPALLDHIGDMVCGFTQRAFLILNRLMMRILD